MNQDASRETGHVPHRHRGRAGIERLIGSDPSTDPIPLVSRLRGTPFAKVQRRSLPNDVLEMIDVVIRVAALSIRTGAGMRDVETNVLAAAASLGLADEHLEFDLTFTSVIVTYAPPGVDPVVRLRVVRSPGRDYARMSALHDLILRMSEGSVGKDEASAELAKVERQPKPYHRYLVRVAWASMTALVVLRLGGDLVTVATSFVATILIDRLGEWLLARSAPLALAALVGAAVAASLGVLVSYASANQFGLADHQLVLRTSLVIAGGVMLLLPGLLMVSVIEDGLWEYPITASARLFQALLSTGAILAGIGGVFALAPSLGAQTPEYVDPLSGNLQQPPWVYVLVTFAATVCAAVGNRVPPRLVVISAVAGSLGVCWQLVAQYAGINASIGVFAAALSIGALARVSAVRRRAVPSAVAVPAMTMLLPGLSVVEGLRLMANGSSSDGVLRLLNAGTTAAAIAVGVVVGSILMSNLEQGLDQVARLGNRLRRSS